jgi:RNA polymerase sigma-70 factor (ECF subfamily)
VVYYNKGDNGPKRPYRDHSDDYMSEHPNSLSDETLAQMARAGDKAAFDMLCDRYLPVVYNRLRAKLPPEAVEDVTQQVFIGAVKGIKRYQERSSFRTWILSIARHKIADYYRSHSRQPEAVPFDLDPDGEAGGCEQRDAWEERALVRIALEQLPEHYQEILLLRFAEGMHFKKIAGTLEISLEAAKSRYRRAVAAIAVEMETERDDDA